MSIQLSSNKRPISALWGSPLEMALDLCALIALALTIVFAVNAWPMLPETIPTHFDFSGQADSFGGKWMIFLLPAVSLVFYIGFSALRRVPHLYNYIWPITPQNAQRQYELARLLMSWFKLEVLALFAYLEWANVQAALNQTSRLDMTFLPVVLLVVFGALVSYLYHAYRAR